jgi:hypothetical protein
MIFYIQFDKLEKFFPLQQILYKHNEHTVKKIKKIGDVERQN